MITCDKCKKNLKGTFFGADFPIRLCREYLHLCGDCSRTIYKAIMKKDPMIEELIKRERKK